MGRARGLRRYRCKGCGRTFNAATGVPLSGLHRKERWLSFGGSPSEGETAKASAERCRVAVTTAFRWRRRFPKAVEMAPEKLRGIVEADETYVLRSRKGERKPDRKARRRGGKAAKRGLSREQVPVLVAADRGGATVSAVLPAVSADALEGRSDPLSRPTSCWCPMAPPSYPPCAAASGVRREALNPAAGDECATLSTSRPSIVGHGQLKGFLRDFRGVATKYLDSYLRWLHLIGLADPASP